MKNSFTYPSYAKKCLDSITNLEEKKSNPFINDMVKNTGQYILHVEDSRLSRLFMRLCKVRKINAYSEETISRAYKAGVVDSHSAVQNVLLKKSKKPKRCRFHKKLVKDCPCIYL